MTKARMPSPAARLGRGVLAALVAVLSIGALSPAISAQQNQGGDAALEVRIIARLLDDGRVEFGLERRQADGSWSTPRLPDARHLRSGVRVGRWGNSSPLSLTTDLTVRIVARHTGDGTVELGLQVRLPDNTWSGPQLPSSRFFPTDGRSGRWSASSSLTVAPPASGDPGGFVAVTSGGTHSCGLHANGSVVCWGENDDGQLDAHTGTYTAVDAGSWHTCGLRRDGSITCWGYGAWGQSDSPRGAYSAISAGGYHSCGLRRNGRVVCWGDNEHGQRVAPVGSFTAITSGYSHSCGLRTSGTVVCWGDNEDGQRNAPEGRFTAVDAGSDHTCGLRRDGTIACWGTNDWTQSNSQRGDFRTISAGFGYTCGLRQDATITCRGYNNKGQAISPSGAFTSVSAGDFQACGVRRDGTITCWGRPLAEELPEGVNMDRGFDPDACRPRGTPGDDKTQYGVTAGFPLSSNAVAATGRFLVAVLFVDFADAPAGRTTHGEAAFSLPDAERYLEAASYGKLDVEFQPLHQWLRADHNLDHYLDEEEFAAGQDVEMREKIVEEAVKKADSLFDFEGFDSVIVVLPSTHFDGGGWYLTSILETDGTVFPYRVLINTYPAEAPYRFPPNRGHIIAHELTHVLGLEDYYGTLDRIDRLPDPPFGKIWITSTFGLMRLNAFFLADRYDPRLAYVANLPGGHSATYRSRQLRSEEMLAWSRWQLGWLDESQVRCIAGSRATVTLTPAAAPGDGTIMAAVPLSETGIIVIESKRRIGYDIGRHVRWSTGARATWPGLAAEGVLVYTIDADRTTEELPLQIAGTDSGGRIDDYPILAVGQSITVRGYTITVDSATDTTHTVSVTKTAAN